MAAPTEVLVLGYGEMGRALESLLVRRARVRCWNRTPRPGLAGMDLAAGLARAEVVICCLPTAAHEPVLGPVLPALATQALCLSVAKGLDTRARPVTRILLSLLGPDRPFGVLHGPMIAEDLQAGRHGFAELGHRGADAASRTLALFAGTRLHVAPSDDLVGINWAVILKNVYAMAFGMADELGLGDNVRGWLVTTAARELDGLVCQLGGRAGTARGLAGLGDLVTTATSAHSHHRSLGKQLARGTAAAALDGEALRTLVQVERGGLLDPAPYPLFRWIHGVVKDSRDVAGRFEALLAGPDGLPG